MLFRSGFEALLERIDATLGLDRVARCTFRIPAGEGDVIHMLHEYARVIATRYDGDVCEIEADTPESIRRRLAKYAVEAATLS